MEVNDEKIIIPTDGSKDAEIAVEQGLKIAKLTNAETIGLYVTDVSEFMGIAGIWERMRRALRKEGREALKKFSKIQTDFKGKLRTVDGIPDEAILEEAKIENADLIVMGTTGKTGAEKVLLGSVYEKVARTAPCPVMVIKTMELQNILVPTDGSIHSNKGVKFAVDFADIVDGKLTILTVDGADAEAIIKKTIGTLEKGKIEAKAKIRRGSPANEILAEAAEGKYDLIIMGRRGLGGIKRFVLGSVSSKTLVHAPCSVTVV